MSLKPPPINHHSRLDEGAQGIDVTLWDGQDPNQAADVIASFYKSTWDALVHPDQWADWSTPWKIAQEAVEGRVLPNTLESLAITFGIENVSRATTHQLVRTRVGAVFGQQGGRDNNWSDYNMRLPQTWWDTDHPGILAEVEKLQKQANSLYQVALKLGVPYQDARYILPMGLETNLVVTYNLLSLKSLLARRLCNRMMWETNWVARKMHDLVVKAYPWVGRSLRSSCEKSGTCGSVSPMFPVCCYTSKGGAIRMASDNPVLQETLSESGLDFPRQANAADAFGEMDALRIKKELDNPDIVMSLTLSPEAEWVNVLAVKEGGEWHAT